MTYSSRVHGYITGAYSSSCKNINYLLTQNYQTRTPILCLDAIINTGFDKDKIIIRTSQKLYTSGRLFPYEQDNSINYSESPRKKVYSLTDMLLEQVRPFTQFINEAWMIKDYIREAFNAIFGREFPKDIIINVCDRQTMKNMHKKKGKGWNNGIVGFAVNKKPGISEIFVLQNNLDKLMLVIGHELGHVLSTRLDDPLDEEAKAFAFEIAWASAVRNFNIGGLRNCMATDIMPAKNGLHDISWNFVSSLLKKGMDAFDIYCDLIEKKLSSKPCFI